MVDGSNRVPWALRSTMKTIYLICILIILISGCGFIRDNCYSVKFTGKNINTDKFTLTLDKAVVFDTTANLLNIKLVSSSNGTPIKEASISMTKNSSTIDGLSDKNGEFQVFQNGFSGDWDITIQHSEVDCISIEDFEIGGGKWITISIKK